jgi:hypothetical protein
LFHDDISLGKLLVLKPGSFYDQLRSCAGSPFALAPTFPGHSSKLLAKMTTIDTNPATLVFVLTTAMTYEDSIKEMYSKTAGNALPSKMTMQAMTVG